MPSQYTPRIPIACLYCNTLNLVTPWEARAGRGRYCTRSCFRALCAVREIESFWNRITRGPDCWLWTGGIELGGYGVARHHGRSVRAHRLAWILASGHPIPDELDICHTCDVRHCQRNDEQGVYVVEGIEYPRWGHLFMAPGIVNDRDRVAKGRAATGSRNGHATHPERTPRGDRNAAHAHPEIMARGEHNAGAKLTAAQVTTLRSDAATGTWTDTALAVKYGLGRTQVRRIIKRESWAHI